MTNKSEHVEPILLEDTDIVSKPIASTLKFDISRIPLFLLYSVPLALFTLILTITLIIFIFCILHIISIFNLDIFSNLICYLQEYFDTIEQISYYNPILILVTYILLIFILGEIGQYIITFHIIQLLNFLIVLTFYEEYEFEIEDEKFNANKAYFHIFLIIISAIILELFFKLFFCDETKYIEIALLIFGTLISSAVFLYSAKFLVTE